MMLISKNKMLLIALLLITVSWIGCTDEYKIHFDNVQDVKDVILSTESLIKKIECIPYYIGYDTYPTFNLTQARCITICYTMLNFNLNDTVINGKHNLNIQCLSDSVTCIPGLTEEEYASLKTNLLRLKEYGLKNSDFTFYNDGRFQFFYYGYYYPENFGYRTIGYLAVLSDSIIKTSDFYWRFEIMDCKDGLYSIRRRH